MASETVRTFSRFFSKSRKHDFLHFLRRFTRFVERRPIDAQRYRQ